MMPFSYLKVKTPQEAEAPQRGGIFNTGAKSIEFTLSHP